MRPGQDSVGGGRRHLDYLFIDTHPSLNEETAVTVEVARKLDVPRLLQPRARLDPRGGARRGTRDGLREGHGDEAA